MMVKSPVRNVRFRIFEKPLILNKITPVVKKITIYTNDIYCN
tara:strand:+ start:781 stop:906 length:126 start_codon:yes stop_codon:yes gene_type:complete